MLHAVVGVISDIEHDYHFIGCKHACQQPQMLQTGNWIVLCTCIVSVTDFLIVCASSALSWDMHAHLAADGVLPGMVGCQNLGADISGKHFCSRGQGCRQACSKCLFLWFHEYAHMILYCIWDTLRSEGTDLE